MQHSTIAAMWSLREHRISHYIASSVSAFRHYRIDSDDHTAAYVILEYCILHTVYLYFSYQRVRVVKVCQSLAYLYLYVILYLGVPERPGYFT